MPIGLYSSSKILMLFALEVPLRALANDSCEDESDFSKFFVFFSFLLDFLLSLLEYLDDFFPLSLEDLDEVQLVMWSDAAWDGDPEDTKSTSGLFLELTNPHNGRRWPISWSVKRQGST